jgi:hypothetical protein
MSTIVTRAGKGSALTWTEGDANITNLNNDKIEDIVEDLTPQLGGDLDVNGKNITSASNGTINITPNGSGNIALTPTTGKIILGALDFPTGTGTNGQVLTTNGSTAMTWTTVSSGGISNVVEDTTPQLGGTLDLNGYSITSNAAGNITIDAGTDKNIALRALGTGHVDLVALAGGQVRVALPFKVGDLVWPSTTGTSGYVLSTNGTDTLSWTNTVASATSASSATVASTVTLTLDSSNASTHFPLFAISGSGNQTIKSDSGFTYNPSTGVLTATQFTGALSGAHNGTVGATTPSTGAFTTLSASSTVSGTGFSTYLASPPAIGGTTRAAGTFSTMTADTAVLDDIRETVFAIGNSGATTLTPNAANGSIQTITATGNFTLSAFTSPVSGQTITFIITQDATGSRTLTSTMKFAGGLKTLSTAANSIDILTVSYIGTTYYASLAKGFA